MYYPTLPYHILPYPYPPHPTLPLTPPLCSDPMYYPTLPYHILPYTTLPAPYTTLPYHTLPSPGALIIYPSLAYPTLPRDEESKEKRRKKNAHLSFPTPSHHFLPYPSISRYSDHMYYPTHPTLAFPTPYPTLPPSLPYPTDHMYYPTLSHPPTQPYLTIPSTLHYRSPKRTLTRLRYRQFSPFKLNSPKSV